MKTLLVVSLLLGSLTALADHHEKMKDMPFAEKKAKVSEKLANRIKSLQENKSCVDSAQDDAALKKCMEKMREERKEMKEKWQKHKSKK